MLDLNKKVQDAKLDHEKTLLYRQIEATDVCASSSCTIDASRYASANFRIYFRFLTENP